jgi:hypothetical protein
MALTGAERQANYIARIKARAAHADVLAARLAEIEAQQADPHLDRFEARHAVARGDDKPLAHRRVPKARARRSKAAAHAR